MALTDVKVFPLSAASNRTGTPKALKTLRDEAEARLVALEAGVASGDVKPSVRAASDGALPAYTRVGNVITANANGALPAQDGVPLAAGEEFLLKDGASGSDNGPQTVTQLGTGALPFILTRRATENTSAEVTAGMVVPVSEGTLFGNKAFKLDTDDPIVLNTTALTFTLIPWGFGTGILAVGTANSAGTTNDSARTNHVHDHGAQTVATHHAVATGVANGFMSSADKTKLDGVEASADNTLAGAGVTKTGSTIDVVANADGSIVANANDIQVGVLATDAQHGLRGGGSQHIVATDSVNGFMSSVDKTKLDAATPLMTGLALCKRDASGGANFGVVGVGTNAPSSKAQLEVVSTTKGFLPPKATTAQRDAIAPAAGDAGLTVYNTTTNKLNFWNGAAWEVVTSA